jgi:translation initiation factor IF-3
MIHRPEVRVINPEGQQLGIYPIGQALTFAQEAGLDLVEINPKANPPVCRIMDFGKFKYEQKKQANLAKKKQKVIEVKEVKMRPKTDDHDFAFKVKHIIRFLLEGNKAKVTIRFRGREIAHPETAARVLDRVIQDVGEIGCVEQPYRLEGRAMTMILAPGKGGIAAREMPKFEEDLPPLVDDDDEDDDFDETEDPVADEESE